LAELFWVFVWNTLENEELFLWISTSDYFTQCSTVSSVEFSDCHYICFGCWWLQKDFFSRGRRVYYIFYGYRLL